MYALTQGASGSFLGSGHAAFSRYHIMYTHSESYSASHCVCDWPPAVYDVWAVMRDDLCWTATDESGEGDRYRDTRTGGDRAWRVDAPETTGLHKPNPLATRREPQHTRRWDPRAEPAATVSYRSRRPDCPVQSSGFVLGSNRNTSPGAYRPADRGSAL